jgi:hypothetical protein
MHTEATCKVECCQLAASAVPGCANALQVQAALGGGVVLQVVEQIRQVAQLDTPAAAAANMTVSSTPLPEDGTVLR